MPCSTPTHANVKHIEAGCNREEKAFPLRSVPDSLKQAAEDSLKAIQSAEGVRPADAMKAFLETWGWGMNICLFLVDPFQIISKNIIGRSKNLTYSSRIQNT